MTPKQRAITSLTGGIPDEIPTFELEFQLTDELLGKDFLRQDSLEKMTNKEKDIAIHENAELMIEAFEKLEYSIIPIHYLWLEESIKTAQIINKMTNYKYLLTRHGDGTFSIPDGNEMYEFAYRIADDPKGLLEQAEKMASSAIERNKRAIDGGIESLILCSDYCYNNGPFISPEQFSIFITPFLSKIIKGIRDAGGYAIKHTDGNIMPILDQLVEANPHAIHSLDPMAGVDIAKVKKLVGDKVCLIGNVNCALLQTGTDEQVIESAKYCLTHGKPNGGYIYSTSNVPFKGLELKRYQLVLDIWKQYRKY
ncbi:MAG TPA: uroporphyrinogen decarboxylase family protein [Clostridia bacterium]|jgi:uroporphyrinogen decarboxylase|nr:MAG: methylcobalamin:coenzyme M methyltransferase [Firmicutes bacterium ADurb.Bin146]HOD92561.1 uroporphyrinogen decarboxylase family protein [Clostridia bacterium]HQM39219.1 uroporphyrinogen decarboxylase family protein [Clostridia bacterium]